MDKQDHKNESDFTTGDSALTLQAVAGLLSEIYAFPSVNDAKFQSAKTQSRAIGAIEEAARSNPEGTLILPVVTLGFGLTKELQKDSQTLSAMNQEVKDFQKYTDNLSKGRVLGSSREFAFASVRNYKNMLAGEIQDAKNLTTNVFGSAVRATDRIKSLFR